ncbi:MAG: MaoC family dehydratase [Deltaproteobacteria bacterium]|nr:MaoC family dehydratase [Deltaproteobacteria bacterium]
MTELAFTSHVKVGEKRYRERFGLDFEDFATGQVFKHRPGLTVSQQDNVEESMDTLNQAMIHFDERYASTTEFTKPLVVSTLTLQRLIGLTWKTFAKKIRILRWADISMTRPVFGGDTLYAETEIKEKQEVPNDPTCGKLTVITRGVNQQGTVICSMEYDLLVYRKRYVPFDKIQY